MQYTKWQLFSLLCRRESNVLQPLFRHPEATGLLLAVEREDGSGCCFNVTVLTLATDDREREHKTVFVRTID